MLSLINNMVRFTVKPFNLQFNRIQYTISCLKMYNEIIINSFKTSNLLLI